ncbi:transcriptional regulator, LysR family [Methylocella silvestris BL2]|uniref:Transcriptional regulator, LysR family n=1 Tax=Methylocella silvestris (strain DSM 15510 / CIP 108128 / LMG 27833 / NCIMB 13906 / BL2) TaxID=395965 RepID=B8ENT3_METSB|nr:LysR family transcriptional regulator [Methylocella silvestris]ACK50869.1 transcriptional regulator, LysR family [Methylocella silvestris BL2]
MDTLLSGSDYNQLRAFVAVGEFLSFSRAAEALGVSPSALSQTVRAFEERVGARLLNRTTRSVALTDAGEILLGRVRPAVTELGDALVQTRCSGERPTGLVRVHSFRLAGERYLEPILGRFARDFPEVVLDVTLDDAVEDVVAGRYDIAIRIGEVIERDMIAVQLGPALRQIAVASPAYLERHGKPEHPRDLLQHRCVRWRWPGRATPYAWEFFENGAWFEVAVDGPLIVNDKNLAVSAALQAAGIAFAVEDVVREQIGSGALVSLLEPWCADFPGYFLCYSSQRQMAPAVRALIDTVRSAAG